MPEVTENQTGIDGRRRGAIPDETPENLSRQDTADRRRVRLPTKTPGSGTSMAKSQPGLGGGTKQAGLPGSLVPSLNSGPAPDSPGAARCPGGVAFP